MITLINTLIIVVLGLLSAYWVIAMIWLFTNLALQALGYEVTVEKREK